MCAPRTLIVAACVVTLAGSLASAKQRDLGRETLAVGDGFASLGDGVTGGAAADADHVFVVRTRNELATALVAAPTGAPRIIYVDGTLDANVDDDNAPLACTDYYRNGYTLEAFVAFYDPAGPWGPTVPANTPGSLEAGRRACGGA